MHLIKNIFIYGKKVEEHCLFIEYKETMVKSKLHTQIEYEESRRLDDEDKKHKTVVYECKLLNQVYRIALGKERTDKTHLGMYYFPVYLLSKKNKIKSKIGVYEVEATRINTIRDEEQDIRVDVLGSPLLFSFVSVEYLNKNGVIVENEKEEQDLQSKNDRNENKEEDVQVEVEEVDDNDDIFSIPKRSKAASKQEEIEPVVLKSDEIFEIQEQKVTETLPEEKQEEAEQIRNAYHNIPVLLTLKDSWIQSTMRNQQYMIVSNEGGGDCLFHSIVQGYETIGRKTTVQKLRQILSQELDMGQLDNYRNLYKMLEQERQELDIQTQKRKQEQIQLKKGSQTENMSRNQVSTIVNKYKEVGEELKVLQQEQEYNKTNLKEFAFMDTITHGMNDGEYKNMSLLEKAKIFITTSDFWADAWAISKLENILEMKTIILTQTDDSTCIVKYTEGEVTQPKFYVMLNHNPEISHYELVTYKGKGALTFSEIPYDMKIMITKHCSQKDAGQFMKINDFKQFKHDLGLYDDDDDEDEQIPDGTVNDLYDDYAELRFHIRAAKELPGKSNGDKISSGLKQDKYFLELINFIKGEKSREDWRKMLDDSWTKSKFQIDNKDWASVEHYLMAVPFKEQNSEMYNNLSLDSNLDIASDLTKARKAIKEYTKKKGKATEKVKALDPDLLNQYRIEALRAKVLQNADITTILIHTKMAKLMKLVQYGDPPEPDIELMKLRKEVQTAKD